MLQLSNPKSAANGWAKALKKVQSGDGKPAPVNEDKNGATKGGAKADAKKTNGKAKATKATDGTIESNNVEKNHSRVPSSREVGDLLLSVASSDHDDPAEFFNNQPFEDAPGGFPGELITVQKPGTPLEVIVGPKKRAPRAPPKPKVDVNGNVLELKKRAPAKPKGKANIKDEKVAIKDEKSTVKDEEEAASASAAPTTKRTRAGPAGKYDEDGNIVPPKRTRVASKKAAAAAAAAMKPTPEATKAKQEEESKVVNQQVLNILDAGNATAGQQSLAMGVTDEELLGAEGGEDNEEAGLDDNRSFFLPMPTTPGPPGDLNSLVSEEAT